MKNDEDNEKDLEFRDESTKPQLVSSREVKVVLKIFCHLI